MLKPIAPIEPPKPRVPKASREVVGPLPVPKSEPLDLNIPFYARDWFKRVMGGVVMIGGVLTLFPVTHYVGIGITILSGGYLEWSGLDHAAAKAGKENIWQFIIEALKAALDALTKYLKREKKL